MPKVVGIDESILKRATCRHCGAINEYMPKEVRVLWSGTDYGGGPDGAEGFNCANCSEHVITKRW
jgi:hypothetical protein